MCQNVAKYAPNMCQNMWLKIAFPDHIKRKNRRLFCYTFPISQNQRIESIRILLKFYMIT